VVTPEAALSWKDMILIAVGWPMYEASRESGYSLDGAAPDSTRRIGAAAIEA